MAGRVNWYRDVFCDYGAEVLLVGMEPTPNGTRRRDRGRDEDARGRAEKRNGRVNCYLTFGMDLWFIFAKTSYV